MFFAPGFAYGAEKRLNLFTKRRNAQLEQSGTHLAYAYDLNPS